MASPHDTKRIQIKVKTPAFVRSGERKSINVDIGDEMKSGFVYIFREPQFEVSSDIKVYPGYWTVEYNPNHELLIKNQGIQDLSFRIGDIIAEMFILKRTKLS